LKGVVDFPFRHMEDESLSRAYCPETFLTKAILVITSRVELDIHLRAASQTPLTKLWKLLF
jgi:hypothetical protein